jgi:hypothetical protein
MIAPEARERPRLGASSTGSKYSTLPMPEHVWQAPCGLLKENSCGVGLGMETLQCEQTASVL